MGKLTEEQLELVKGLFEGLDTDGSGSLEPADIRAALEEQECDDEIKKCICELLEADLDGDGKVSLAEFVVKIQELEDC